MKIKIYTDGACSGNPGKGGWAAIILDSNANQSNISGNEKNTTNNRMELMAPIMALKKIKKRSEIIIYTDSRYVKDGITEWIKKWKLNNWKNSNKKPVKNKDLWIKLDNSCQKHKVNWKWVKANAGNKFNNLVDQLAVSFSSSIFFTTSSSTSIVYLFDLTPNPFADLSTSAPMALVNLRKGSPAIKILLPTL